MLKKIKKWSRRFIVASVLVGVFGVTGAVGSNLYVSSQAREKMYELEDPNIPEMHTAIVLGARAMPDGTPSSALRDRLYAALDLYKRGKVKRILVTGDNAQDHYNEVLVMFRWLHKRGVPAKHIFADHAGLRTFDSMHRAKHVFEVKDAIICTQEFHLARSIFLAKKHGIRAVGAIADRRVYAKRNQDARREFIARTVAVADVYLIGRKPRFGGDKIPIKGDASLSWDEAIVSVIKKRQDHTL